MKEAATSSKQAPRKMRFDDANQVAMTVWRMRLDDWKPGKNRALIDRVFNGAPPWQEKELDQNNIQTNINELSGPRYMADARRSLERALETSNTYFKADIDYGPSHKRGDWSAEVTNRINRLMKRSRVYSEMLSSQMALKCLHGIGPAFWINQDRWDPIPIAIQDVLIPMRTYRSLENLDHFAVFRQLTHEQLYKMTHCANSDPGWNMDVVDSALKWVREQTVGQVNTWANWYAPQNLVELDKESQGYLGTSAVPTVDVWDFYFHEDADGKEGWRRGMILDTPYSGGDSQVMPSQDRYGMDHSRWLYKPSAKRVYAEKLEHLLHFQFGDATSTAPFRYHGVRSLGWLLYPFLHLQNRLYSKFVDHLFENLLNYIRVNRQEDYEDFVKLQLHREGLIPNGVQFVKQEERWQINQPLIELGFMQNRSHMDEAAAQYREGRESQRPSERETATAVVARVNAAAALVGALISNTYKQQTYQYAEICRRFCRKDSQDRDVRKFRADVLAAGVPESALNVDCWDITPDKVLGNGNKMMAMAMVQEMMATYGLHDPQAQKEILELHDREVTDNPELARRWSGTDRKETSPTVISAQRMVGTLMQGVPVQPQRGENPEEMVTTLLHSMATIVQRVSQTGPTMAEIVGLSNLGNTIGGYLALFEQQDKSGKAKAYGNDLKALMKAVGDMGKQLQQAQAEQAQAGGQPQIDPAAIGKIRSQEILAKAKADTMMKSHASRTAQKQVQFEQKMKQDAEKHAFDMQKQAQQQGLDQAMDIASTAHEMRRDSAMAAHEASLQTETREE